MNGQPRMRRAAAGELLGTHLLVLFGSGSVATAVLSGAQVGLWQVAAVWGFGVAVAIYVSAGLSAAWPGGRSMAAKRQLPEPPTHAHCIHN